MVQPSGKPVAGSGGPVEVDGCDTVGSGCAGGVISGSDVAGLAACGACGGILVGTLAGGPEGTVGAEITD